MASQLRESFEKCEELRQEMQTVRRDYEHRLTLQAEEHREREDQIKQLTQERAKLEEQWAFAEERENKCGRVSLYKKIQSMQIARGGRRVKPRATAMRNTTERDADGVEDHI